MIISVKTRFHSHRLLLLYSVCFMQCAVFCFAFLEKNKININRGGGGRLGGTDEKKSSCYQRKVRKKMTQWRRDKGNLVCARDNETIREVCPLCEGSISTIMNELAANCLECSRARAHGGVQRGGKSGVFILYRNQHSTSLWSPPFVGGGGDRGKIPFTLCHYVQ